MNTLRLKPLPLFNQISHSFYLLWTRDQLYKFNKATVINESPVCLAKHLLRSPGTSRFFTFYKLDALTLFLAIFLTKVPYEIGVECLEKIYKSSSNKHFL